MGAAADRLQVQSSLHSIALMQLFGEYNTNARMPELLQLHVFDTPAL